MPSDNISNGAKIGLTEASLSGGAVARGFLAQMSTTRANANAGLMADSLVALILLGCGAYANNSGVLAACVTVALGFLAFTFAEYCVHRWLFHRGDGAMRDGHARHHDEPRGYDALPFFAPPTGMLGVAALLALVLPTGLALLLAGTIAAGYAAYGLGHTIMHVRRFRWRVAVRWAAHHHIHHHHPGMNFGVTTPLWDYVFATRYVSARKRTRDSDVPAQSASVAPGARVRRAALLIGLAVLATLAVPIVLGGRQALAQTLSFPVQSFAALLGLLLISWLARAWKLHVLLQQIGTQQAFMRTLAMSLAIDFAFISTPAGVGGYAASIYYVRRSGASASAATTVTAVDQLLDLGIFVVILPLAGLSLIWSELPTALAFVAFVTSALMIALGLAALLMRRKLANWMLAENALVRRWPGLRRQQVRLQKFLTSLRADIDLLKSSGVRGLMAIAALTTVQWLTRYGVLWATLGLLGHQVSFALTLLLQSLILHAALWTGVPSGGGGAEIGLSAALAAWVPATSMASALIIWRLVTFDVCLVVGIVAVVWLARSGMRTSVVPAQLGPTNTADST
ncbi:MAG TPA: flippase-like domain-containing protein [Rudaea sp.]|nr:flippase-like domain-containing protein [Rudaea sp.]